MRILLAISTLGAGGAERVITILANELARRGHGITLLTLDRASQAFYGTGTAVSRIGLDLVTRSGSLGTRVYWNVRRVGRIRRTIAELRPDVIVSFITEMNVITILACAGLGIPIVISERIDPREHPLSGAWSMLRRATYSRVRVLVVQTPDVASWCREHWSVRSVVAIPNPVTETAPRRHNPSCRARPFLLGVGRLDQQKGFDVLIRSFALLATQLHELDLCIAGEGPESSNLRLLARQLNVSDRVIFLGQVRNIEQLMTDAFAFVLSSRYEGFPNVLLEALSNGAATIATDCRSGPRQILRGGQFGLLVPPDDPVTLASAVRQLWSDSALRTQLRVNARHAVRPYSIDAVLGSWEQVLVQAVHQ